MSAPSLSQPRSPALTLDTAHHILSHLTSPSDLAHASAVSRLFRQATHTSPSLWLPFLPSPPATPLCHPFSLFLASQSWHSATALTSSASSPFRPSHLALSPSPSSTYALAVAPSTSLRPQAFGPSARSTPIALYASASSAPSSPARDSTTTSRHVGGRGLNHACHARVQHPCGAIPALLRIRAGGPAVSHALLIAYVYEDARVALFALDAERVAAEGGAGVDARCVFLAAPLSGAGRVTAVDVCERSGTVFVGTMFGEVAAFAPVDVGGSVSGGMGGFRVARTLVSGSAVLSLRAAGGETSVLSGLAGTTVGEVVAFDLGRCVGGEDAGPTAGVVTRYVGPSRHPVAAVAYAGSFGGPGGSALVAATYVPTSVPNSCPPVATAWDACSGRRVGRFETHRLRGRRAGVRDVAVGGESSGDKMGLLLGGAVLVYDVRRWQCIAEVGEDCVGALDMRGNRVALGQSMARFSPRSVARDTMGGEEEGHEVTVLDFGMEAARAPAEMVERFPPDRECDRPWCVSA